MKPRCWLATQTQMGFSTCTIIVIKNPYGLLRVYVVKYYRGRGGFSVRANPDLVHLRLMRILTGRAKLLVPLFQKIIFKRKKIVSQYGVFIL